MKDKVYCNFNKVRKSGLFPGDWILLKAVIFTGVAIYFGVCALTEYQKLAELYSGTTHDILNNNIEDLPVHQLTELLGSQKFINSDAQGKEKMLLDLKDFIINFLKQNPNLSELAKQKATDLIQLCSKLAKDASLNEPDADGADFLQQSLEEAKKVIKEIQNRKTKLRDER